MHKTNGGRKPKKKIYHRVHELDRVMELQKKPSLILQLKSIIQSRKSESLLLRDLEKEVGFVQKWNYMAVIEKYPSIFFVTGGKSDMSPTAVMLSEKAKKTAALEAEVRGANGTLFG
ncbi:Ubiquitin carboxyl-terminal hydrolase family protein [Abeliophyllum distichum]|uniref:Ubiquitin carboxyl-terminal hydrolase family protein n=1 Tax=Abeliophyllum distichum TaxID=126358 RepID=A0ABD1NPZ5_9LAMI